MKKHALKLTRIQIPEEMGKKSYFKVLQEIAKTPAPVLELATG
jgi:hypothetical protein